MEHFDVLIIGAGISGIGAAHHLQTRCPRKSFAVLEARDSIGGTWDLFKYPGIRSDSDMYTLGFQFKPWTDPKSIAGGPAIMEYLQETVRECGIEERIRFGHRVVRSEWSSAQSRWTLTVQDAAAGTTRRLSCGFLFACSGYYRYDRGYTPDFDGVDDFQGAMVHPQRWPEDLEYAGKRVVVIGSGATAVTVVPELAKQAEHVVMLQRSPTYMFVAPARDRLAELLRGRVPPKWAYAATRWKHIGLSMAFYQLARRYPDKSARWLVDRVRRRLPEGFDVETHFTPSYKPWDQRICLVPHGDLFTAISEGSVSVVTDHIERFTEGGLLLRSGEELRADLVVSATGLHMELFSGHELWVDDHQVVPRERMSYRAMMLGGVPNFAFAVGYTNASWTLKVDIACSYVCRLLNHMDRRGYTVCVPQVDPRVADKELLDFTPGYVRRALDRLPRAGAKHPWRVFDNYILDRAMLKHGLLDDGVMRFERRPGDASGRSRWRRRSRRAVRTAS